MPFSENLKREVKRKAHFKCCWCRKLNGSLDAHHIIPESKDGPNTIDNAAPLCKKCHDIYGSNPSKRKEIRERKDFWYDFCEKQLHNEDINKLEELHKTIKEIQERNHKKITEVEEGYKILQTYVGDLVKQNQILISSLDQTSEDKKPEIFAQIGSTSNTISGSAVVMTQLGRGVYANSVCQKCGASIGLYISNQSGPPVCPTCKTPMQ